MTAADALRAFIEPLAPGWAVQLGKWRDGGPTARAIIIKPIGGVSASLIREPQFSVLVIGGCRDTPVVCAGVVQMSELIDAMLSLAQVSRSDLRWEAVDLSALAHGLLAGYQERSPSRPAHWQIEPGLLAQGDTRLLKQVLDNLLGNAWKFTAGQARAEITLTHETSPSGETIYVVQDNGAGFDMAYASRLFGAFQRLHAQSEFAGTGIGLATVARIVERHNGRVWAEATPGKGARFYFTLGATSA